MRIAFLLGDANGKGGIARVTSIVAENLLCSTSHEVFIISYCGKHLDKTGSTSNVIHYETIFDTPVSLRSGFLKARKALRKCLVDNEIDILVSCGALYFVLGAVSAKGLKTKTIAWEHSNYTSNTGHIGKKYNRKIGAKLSDYVVTLTQMDKENYLKNIRNDKVEYIYNPIDPLLLKHEVIYRPKEKRIITVGNLNPFKNYGDLVKVAVKVFSNSLFSDWQWDIYGDGSKKAEINRLIKENNLSGKVILQGRVSNIYDLLNSYSIYVCTSKSEGLPMALLEAKAKKLPIVSFDIMTGPREIISDGENGYLVELHDIDAMASKLMLLMESPDKRREFSENAYIGIEQFSMDTCIQKWNSLFHKVLGDT